MNTTMLRLHKNEDSDGLYSLKSSGADITDYREQLAHERNARTLTLRRSKKPTIAAFLSRAPRNPLTSPLIDPNNFPFLDLSFAINQLESGNTTNLSEFLSNILMAATHTPRLVADLVKSPELAGAFINALNAGYSEEINTNIVRTLTVIFPISDDNRINFIDEGLCMSLFDFLSTETIPLLEASIALVDVMSENSSYARDSILCLGLHQFLIDIAKKEYNENITLQAIEALNKIFSNKHKIDTTTLSSCVEPMAELLTLHSPQAVNAVLMCFVAMTDQLSALVFNLDDLHLFPLIVSMLGNPDLVSAALPLIGNMSVCHATHVATMLDLGLFPLLMNLINTEYTADVFWVLSNLVESVPHLTIGLFDKTFIEKTVDIAIRSSFEVKKESTFFIATLVLFTASDDLIYFMSESVLDLMIEMLGCNVSLIVLRCMDSLLRFSRAMETRTASEDFVRAMYGDEMSKILTDVCSTGSRIIQERAQYLLNKIDNESSSLLAF